eukprot:2483685-Amphidinium_carterae.1
MDLTRSLSGMLGDKVEARPLQSAPTRDQTGLDGRRPGKLDTRKSATSTSLPAVSRTQRDVQRQSTGGLQRL